MKLNFDYCRICQIRHIFCLSSDKIIGDGGEYFFMCCHACGYFFFDTKGYKPEKFYFPVSHKKIMDEEWEDIKKMRVVKKTPWYDEKNRYSECPFYLEHMVDQS